MFLNIIKFRESIFSVILFIINLFVVDFIYLLEFIFCKWIPRKSYFHFYSSSGRKDSSSSNNNNLLIYKVWNWPSFLQDIVFCLKRLLFLSSSSSPSGQCFPTSSPEPCFVAENIVYATTNNQRFARAIPLLRPDQWYQNNNNSSSSFFSTNAGGGISCVQAVENPTAMNNPLLLCPSIWIRISNMFSKLFLSTSSHQPLQQLYVGQEFESLVLNVWMPSKNYYNSNQKNDSTATAKKSESSSSSSSSSKQPPLLDVYVFVAGGAFTFGTASQSMHDPRDFISSSRKSVFVTINYRLGILGFLQGFEQEAGIEANLGMTDVTCALLWVKANIHRFGGDPDKVCVIGQSAGAMLLGAMLVSPHVRHVCEKYQSAFPNNIRNDKTNKDNENNQNQHRHQHQLFQTAMLMSGAAVHVHGPKEREACRDIMKLAIHKVLLDRQKEEKENHHRRSVSSFSSASSSSSSSINNINYRELLLKASLNELILIQSAYCNHIDNLYRNCELETRFIPFNLCVNEDEICNSSDVHSNEKIKQKKQKNSTKNKSDLIPVHPQIALRNFNKRMNTNNNNKNKNKNSGRSRKTEDEDDVDVDVDVIVNCNKVLISTTGSEYTMFAMKHQNPATMNNEELQIAQTMKRAKQFTAAAFEKERNDPLVNDIATKLAGTYVSVWKSNKTSRNDENYITRQYKITSNDPSLIYKGQLWSQFCGDWTFRIPAECLAQDLDEYFQNQKKDNNNNNSNKKKSHHCCCTKMIRVEAPCDPIPPLSSPHTSDVPFLFGACHVFPAICSYKWIYCAERRNLSKALQNLVKDFHQHRDEKATITSSSSLSSSSSTTNVISIPESNQNKFWKPNYSTRNIDVLSLAENMQDVIQKDNSEFERALLNQVYDPIFAQLMEFRK